MDRFYYYLLGAMAAILLVAVGFIMFTRHKEDAARLRDAVTPTPTPADLLPTATPARPWSTPGSADAVLGATPSVLTAPPTPTPVPWTPPNVGKTVSVGYVGFTVVYSPQFLTPLAAQYALVQGAKPKRYPEPAKVPVLDSKLIAAAGYAKGEMAFAKSISLYFGPQAGRNATLMSNLSAMDPATLAGPWAQLSERELRYSGEYKWTEIVAGPILGNPPVGIGRLVVPVAFYRVYRRAYGDTMALIVPQGATSIRMETYLTSIAAVEAATGIAIFTNTIPDEERVRIATEVW